LRGWLPYYVLRDRASQIHAEAIRFMDQEASAMNNTHIDRIFSINPKEYRKNKTLITFLSVFSLCWFVGIFFIIRKIIIEFSPSALLYLIICSVIFLFVIFILSTMNAKELIMIDDDHIIMDSSIPLNTKKKIQCCNLKGLLLDERDGGGANLQLVYQIADSIDTVPIAPFVNRNDKITLQRDLSEFFKKHGLSLEIINNLK